MGSMSVGENYNLYKKRQHDSFFSSIHRARVTDVHIEKGTISVLFERMPYSREVTIPLLGLSVPTGDETGRTASWGRYIPQVGDMIVVGFDSNGECFALNYHAVYYKGLTLLDDNREDRGGIGWGKASGKDIKPGDWDFKSSRGCFFYLGDRAQISSGPYSISLNKSTADITTKGQLLIDTYGEASSIRAGAVRRMALPTDTSETYMPDPTNPSRTLQEWTNVVRAGSFVNPEGIELARYQMGEVIAEPPLFLPMVPVVDFPDLALLTGLGVRHYRSSKDPSGTVSMYDELVDDLGNYGVSALTAVAFQWLTPTAMWSITNKDTAITSSATFLVVSPSITLQAAASAIVDAPSVSLGGPSATEPLVKGTQFVSSLTTFLSAIIAGTATVGTMPQNAAALTAIGAAAQILLNQLSGLISTSVFTE